VAHHVETAMLSSPVSSRDHMQGSPSAPVVLVEYGDYECPFCGQAYQVVKEVQRLLGKQLCFVFRNFPLNAAHPHAEHAAEAAEAAGAQNAFWQMHDVLYENQDALEDENLSEYAADLGLDTMRFNLEMATHRYVGRVREDFLSGIRSGVNGTPCFFINGMRHDGGWDAGSLIAAIRESVVE
jgi:protein-disulfide isomerase